MQGYNNCDHIYSFGQDQNSGCLWLGDYNSARNKKIHREKSIQTVITAGLGMKVTINEPTKHRLYPLYDSPAQNIQRFFEQAFEHIQEGLKNGNVLVHCFAGVSRSSTIVMSYLMKKLNWSYKQAFDHVRKKRWVINPNPGFVKQLRRYDVKLKNSNNPQSPEKIVEKQKEFLKTIKPQIKKQISFQSNASTTLTKSYLNRGKSIMQQKNNSKNYSFSVMKK